MSKPSMRRGKAGSSNTSFNSWSAPSRSRAALFGTLAPRSPKRLGSKPSSRSISRALASHKRTKAIFPPRWGLRTSTRWPLLAVSHAARVSTSSMAWLNKTSAGTAEAPAQNDALPFPDQLNGAHAVAPAGGFLETFALGRRLHASLNVVQQAVFTAFKEQLNLTHMFAVLFLRLPPGNARRVALVQVVVEAWTVHFAVNLKGALADPEVTMHQTQNLPHGRHVHKRPKVAVLGQVRAARHQKAGIVLAERQLQIGIALVVAQQNVKTGPKSFDEVFFKHQGFHFGADDQRLQGMYLRHHQPIFGA